MWKVVGTKWKNYRKYMQPLNIMCRLINGLRIKKYISSSNNNQTADPCVLLILLQFIRHILSSLNIENVDPNATELPLYIAQLLEYQVLRPEIKLKFEELNGKHVWLNCVFFKQIGNEFTESVLSITNIAVLFCNSQEICFLMPKDGVFGKHIYQSLVDDLAVISEMGLSIVISFEWPSEMSVENGHKINEYLQQFMTIKSKWLPNVSTQKL
eukprot:525327_1